MFVEFGLYYLFDVLCDVVWMFVYFEVCFDFVVEYGCLVDLYVEIGFG